MGPAGVYSTFKPDHGPGGGMVSMPNGNTGWLSYVGVEDIQNSTEKARELGANIVVGPLQIPDIGWITVITDPTGCTIAIFQPTLPG